MAEKDLQAEMEKVNALRDSGVQFSITPDGRMTSDKPFFAEVADRGLETLAGAVGGLFAGGAVAAVGTPGDLVGIVDGIYESIVAEDGERLEAFLTTLVGHSETYGSEALRPLALAVLDRMPGNEQVKETMRLGFEIGDIYGVPTGLSATAKVATAVGKKVVPPVVRAGRAVIQKGLEKVDEAGQAAQTRLDEQGGPRLMSGIDPVQAKDELVAGAGQVARAVLPKKTIITEELASAILPDKRMSMQPPEVLAGLSTGARAAIRQLAAEKRASQTVEPGLDDMDILTGDEVIRALGPKMDKVPPAVVPEAAPTRVQDELGFYSRAQEFVDNLDQASMTGVQLKGQMLNAGVKPDELKWTGLDDFLEENPKVTKQEVSDFLDQNKVKLEEITYEGGTLNPDTHQSFGNAEVIDDYDEVAFQRERIDDDINSGEDFYLEQALEIRGYNVPSGVAAYKELMQATGGRPSNVDPEVVAPIQAKYPDVDVKNVGWEVDAQLDEIAKENYFDNPYYEVNGEGMLEDYRIVGNDDTGYYVTYQGKAVDDITDVYSLNEAQVQVQQDAIDRGLDVGAGETQYSEYTQEGAENYREVLLTNPGYKGDPSFELSETQRARLKELKEKVNAEMERRTQSGEAPIYGPQDALSSREMTDYEALNWQDQQVGMPPRSPHWRENDVVAHARLSDRTVMGGERIDVEGGKQRIPKALYIEELQSDWAQIGRRRGFGAQEIEFSEPVYKGKDDKGRDTWVVNSKDADGFDRPYKFLGGPTDFPTKEAALEAIEREKKIRPKSLGRVQEGPLVGKTDKWTEMAMRRLIRKAADEGYDYIAWTPGDVQVDRWGEEGLETYYNNVLPKSTGKVAKKLDKEATVGPIEINIDGEPQKTLALPITEKLKTMAKEGQPMFAVPAAVGVGAALKDEQGAEDGNL